MDFGLARVLRRRHAHRVRQRARHAALRVAGAAARARPIDRRTDIYSTGVMAYEMLAGRRPFEPDNDSISSVILKVIQQPAAPMDTDTEPHAAGDRDRSCRARWRSRRPSATSRPTRCGGRCVNFLEQSRDRISAIESRADRRCSVRVRAEVDPDCRHRRATSAIVGSKTMMVGRRRGRGGRSSACCLIAAPSRSMEEPSPSRSRAPPRRRSLRHHHHVPRPRTIRSPVDFAAPTAHHERRHRRKPRRSHLLARRLHSHHAVSPAPPAKELAPRKCSTSNDANVSPGSALPHDPGW